MVAVALVYWWAALVVATIFFFLPHSVEKLVIKSGARRLRKFIDANGGSAFIRFSGLLLMLSVIPDVMFLHSHLK